MNDDAVLRSDWHPVASSAALTAQALLATTLLDTELVLWRDGHGAVQAWEDRCPHRGMKLSKGARDGDALVCAYHGWSFAADAQCTQIPAMPGFRPPQRARARTHPVRERYGMVWVCLGDPAGDVPPFPEYADTRLRKVLCGPYEVAASGPRIVENFLDMAHFAFVHEGILGDREHPEIPDYEVAELPEGGVIATRCRAWQPRTNSLALEGSDVEYAYRVVRPLTAILNKLPAAQPDFREAISLHVQPVTQDTSRAWVVLAMTNFADREEDLRAFQDRIFLQDLPIVENQRPLRLPLSPEAEVSVACDRMSVAYRRYLSRLGLRYGVVTAEDA